MGIFAEVAMVMAAVLLSDLIAKPAWDSDFRFRAVDGIVGSVFTNAGPILMQPVHQRGGMMLLLLMMVLWPWCGWKDFEIGHGTNGRLQRCVVFHLCLCIIVIL